MVNRDKHIWEIGDWCYRIDTREKTCSLFRVGSVGTRSLGLYRESNGPKKVKQYSRNSKVYIYCKTACEALEKVKCLEQNKTDAPAERRVVLLLS